MDQNRGRRTSSDGMRGSPTRDAPPVHGGEANGIELCTCDMHCFTALHCRQPWDCPLLTLARSCSLLRFQGWRLDYFLTSSSLMPPGEVKPKVEPPPAAEGEQQQSTEGKPTPTRTAPATSWRVYDSWIRQDVYGSDHLPIGLTLVRSGGAVS